MAAVEYRLADGRVFVTGQDVEVQIHADDYWVPAVVANTHRGDANASGEVADVPVIIRSNDIQRLVESRPEAAGQESMDEIVKSVWWMPADRIREVN